MRDQRLTERNVLMCTSLLAAALAPLLGNLWFDIAPVTAAVVAAIVFIPLLWIWFTIRFIPNDYVGIVEKLWSSSGSIGEGQIIALNGEAGYQAQLLRGGVH